jgi:thiamine-monophosphate kinase
VGATVAGGDTVAAEVVTVSVTALGSLDGRAPVTRRGARPGDLIRVLGTLGRSAAGLALLDRGDATLLDRHRELVAVHRVPEPPYGVGRLLADGGASAMIDVSDGLAADLGHLLAASGLAAEIDLSGWADSALDAAARDLGISADEWICAGGEDHALLFTHPVDAPDVRGVAIGRTVAGSGVTWAGGRGPRGMPGHDHFGGLR